MFPAIHIVLRAYYKELADLISLSLEEERELIKAAHGGCKESHDKIICHNLKFVVLMASRYAKGLLDYDELISEGNIGLLEALRHYNLDNNVKLITYAVWRIKEKMIKANIRSMTCFDIPYNKLQNRLAITREVSKFKTINMRSPTYSELSKIIGVSEKEIQLLLERLDKFMCTGTDDEDMMNNTIEVEGTGREETDNQQEDILLESIEKLPSPKKEVIMWHFGIGSPSNKTHSLRNIAIKLKLSVARVSQLKEEGLKLILKDCGETIQNLRQIRDMPINRYNEEQERRLE